MGRTPATLLAFLATAAPAAAAPDQESILMDDPKIVYSTPDRLEGTLAEIKRLGADRIRVSVFWHLLAPDPKSETRPFGAGAGANPASYAADKWDRYDLIVTTAQRVGLKLLFSVTSPAPFWATPAPPRADLEDSFRPSVSEYKDFVKAVATRYSGRFADEAPRHVARGVFQQCDPTPNFPLPPPVCPATSDPTPTNPNPPNTGAPLPRVDAWSIWNEPNMPGWLTPQWHESSTRLPASPHVYRELAGAMYSALHETGHGGDMILLAETAPRGAFKRAVTQSIAPLLFVRELYCLDRSYRPFTGQAARDRNCPDGGTGFASANPALFNVTGFAHHPYAFEAPPGASDRTRDHAVLADLSRLTTTLDRALRAHGSARQLPIWLTEYGYQTDPPDPYIGWSWKTHVRYLAEAEWLAFRHPRVRSTAQFLLYDDAPLRQYPPKDPRHWGTFQTGLLTMGGRRKNAYTGYQRTIHVTPGRVKRGRRVRVFGHYRPGSGIVSARVQFKRRGTSRWRHARNTHTNAHGFMVSSFKATEPGAYRIGFLAGGQTLYTRSVGFSVSR